MSVGDLGRPSQPNSESIVVHEIPARRRQKEELLLYPVLGGPFGPQQMMPVFPFVDMDTEEEEDPNP